VIGKKKEILKKIHITKNENNFNAIINLILTVFYTGLLAKKLKNLFFNIVKYPNYDVTLNSNWQCIFMKIKV